MDDGADKAWLDAQRERGYPLGARVQYIDGNATTSGDDPVLASGVVNGEPLEVPDGLVDQVTGLRENLTYVPVFTSRDKGREPTTVWVAHPNIVAVDGP